MAIVKGSCRDALSLMGDVTNVLFTYLAVCMLRSILQIINSLSQGGVVAAGNWCKTEIMPLSGGAVGIYCHCGCGFSINFKLAPANG
jgi:hypothetical protein